MQFDLITFGETLVRMSPTGSRCIEQAQCFDMCLAGSELNVAVSAKRLGLSVSYVTKVANNPLGRIVVNKCREQGVDTSWIQMCDARQGIYFFEPGSKPRPGVGWYDRENSAFAQVGPKDFDWQPIFKSSKMFLTSGINLALSVNAREATLKAVKSAKEQGLTVCFDINYRSKLWSKENAAQSIREFLPYVDILFTSAGDASDILGFKEPPSEELASKISQQLGIAVVCLVYGLPNVKMPLWRIACATDSQVYTAQQDRELTTVDRLGAGDAFAGGFLAGYLKGGPELGVKYGNAMMTLKNTFLGDFSWATAEMIENYLADGDQMLIR